MPQPASNNNSVGPNTGPKCLSPIIVTRINHTRVQEVASTKSIGVALCSV